MGDSLVNTKVLGQVNDFIMFKNILEYKDNDFGLSSMGFVITSVQESDEELIMEWEPPSTFKTFLKKWLPTLKTNLLMGIVFLWRRGEKKSTRLLRKLSNHQRPACTYENCFSVFRQWTVVVQVHHLRQCSCGMKITMLLSIVLFAFDGSFGAKQRGSGFCPRTGGWKTQAGRLPTFKEHIQGNQTKSRQYFSALFFMYKEVLSSQDANRCAFIRRVRSMASWLWNNRAS